MNENNQNQNLSRAERRAAARAANPGLAAIADAAGIPPVPADEVENTPALGTLAPAVDLTPAVEIPTPAPAVDLSPKVKAEAPTTLTPEQEARSKMTRKERFLAEFATDKPVQIKIGDYMFTAYGQEFKTGSVGWNVNGKAIINGQSVQIGVNLTVVKSKEWAD